MTKQSTSSTSAAATAAASTNLPIRGKTIDIRNAAVYLEEAAEAEKFNDKHLTKATAVAAVTIDASLELEMKITKLQTILQSAKELTVDDF